MPRDPLLHLYCSDGHRLGPQDCGPALLKFTGIEVGNAEPRSVGRARSQDSATSKHRVGAEEHTGEKALIPTLTCLLSPTSNNQSNKRLARKAASCPCDPVGTIPRQPPPAMLVCGSAPALDSSLLEPLHLLCQQRRVPITPSSPLQASDVS